MILDIGPKILFGTIPTPAYDLDVKVTDLEIYVKVLRYIWHAYRYWSKILFGTIPTPAYDLGTKVTNLEIYFKINVKKIAFGNKEHTTDKKMGVSVLLKLFTSSNEVCVKVFNISLFLNHCMDLLYIWHDNRYWSEILFSTTPTL